MFDVVMCVSTENCLQNIRDVIPWDKKFSRGKRGKWNKQFSRGAHIRYLHHADDYFNCYLDALVAPGIIPALRPTSRVYIHAGAMPSLRISSEYR